MDRSKVMVMSQETWDIMSDKLAEEATERVDPLAWISRYDGIPIIIDDTIPYNNVEVYERWMYDAVTKYGKKRGESNAGDVG
jgi:hypothetical protein